MTEGRMLSESIRTVLTSLITAGVVWLVYTTVETKSQIELVNYKIEQIGIDIKTLSEKVK